MKRIAIIGLGLIGGSMGLALKRSGLEAELVGYARTAETGRKALELGAVDRLGQDLASTVRDAALVYLAPPVLALQDIMRQIAPHLPPGCTVTDAGSTKSCIMEWAAACLPGDCFVGGHPMAGKETSGIAAADAALFQGCTYCLVPAKGASAQAVADVVELVKLAGGAPLFLTAQDHDYFVAGISHLPFVISSALAAAAGGDPSWKPMSRLAAGGFRDTTRLASQSPEMELNICLSNRDNILCWIDRFSRELESLRGLISSGDGAGLETAFSRARNARQQWLAWRENDQKN